MKIEKESIGKDITCQKCHNFLRRAFSAFPNATFWHSGSSGVFVLSNRLVRLNDLGFDPVGLVHHDEIVLVIVKQLPPR